MYFNGTGILSGTKKDSLEVEGIVEAAEIASQIAHMEKAKPEQTAEILFNLRNMIENCPDTLVSQNRSIVSYLDAYETNLLTGERGKPISLILFTDKVMVVRRPKCVSGETLFQLKEELEEKRRREKEEKERKERDKKLRKDTGAKKEDGAAGTGPVSLGSGAMAAAMMLLRKDWKFLGWMDILKLRVSIVEQSKFAFFFLFRPVAVNACCYHSRVGTEPTFNFYATILFLQLTRRGFSVSRQGTIQRPRTTAGRQHAESFQSSLTSVTPSSPNSMRPCLSRRPLLPTVVPNTHLVSISPNLSSFAMSFQRASTAISRIRAMWPCSMCMGGVVLSM
jgi:hypothetical protein